MSALPVPAGVPDWVHILPRQVLTRDGRGPYRYQAGTLIAASMADDRRVPVDENHSTETLGPQGLPSPARGYVAAMEEREDGIWARIDWTESGRALMSDRAYWGVSPVLIHTKDGEVLRIKSVALTNTPNLRGLTALNTEQEAAMEEVLAKIKTMLGLAEDDDMDKVWHALSAVIDAAAAEKAKVASGTAAMSEIATALGLTAGAEATEIVTAAQAAMAGKDQAITALQSELRDVAGQLKALKDSAARHKAEAFVDGAIRAGRVGVKPLRDHYVSRHMADAAAVELEIGALPTITATHTTDTPPADPTLTSLNAEQTAVMRAMGLSEEAYLATLKAQAKEA